MLKIYLKKALSISTNKKESKMEKLFEKTELLDLNNKEILLLIEEKKWIRLKMRFY